MGIKYYITSAIHRMLMPLPLVVFLIALFLASFLVAALPSNNANSAVVLPPQPIVSVSPTSGCVGTYIKVSGSNFPIGSTVRVSICTRLLDGSCSFLFSAIVGDTGHFVSPKSARIPCNLNLTPGEYTIYANVPLTYIDATCTFAVTVNPTCTVYPQAGMVGTQLQVMGSCFTPFSTVQAVLCGQPVLIASGLADTCGYFLLNGSVPDFLEPGTTYNVCVGDGVSQCSSTFTVTETPPVTPSDNDGEPTLPPTLTLSPTFGGPADMVTLTGSNFSRNDTIRVGGITFDGMAWNTSRIPTDAFGEWEASLAVPDWAAAGSHSTVRVTTEGGSAAAGMFVVYSPEQEVIQPPSAPKGPAEGIVGQSLSYSTGAALSSLGHDIQTQFEWGNGTQSAWLDGGGSVIVSASHSWSSAGTYSVRARARCATHTEVYSEWSQGSSVAIKLKQAIIDLSPKSGSPGTMITLTGSNFVAHDTIPVGGLTFDAAPWNTSPITANEDGGWHTILPVPDAASPGIRMVKAATQGNSTASNPFTVLSTPPPTQPPVTPTPLPFAMSNLVIDPKTISPGGNVTVSADIENVGDTERSEIISLKIKDEVVTMEPVTLAAGQKTTIAFAVSRDALGSYDVAIGELGGSFKVVKSTPGVRWSIVGGTIFAVIVLALLALFIRRLVREV